MIALGSIRSSHTPLVRPRRVLKDPSLLQQFFTLQMSSTCLSSSVASPLVIFSPLATLAQPQVALVTFRAPRSSSTSLFTATVWTPNMAQDFFAPGLLIIFEKRLARNWKNWCYTHRQTQTSTWDFRAYHSILIRVANSESVSIQRAPTLTNAANGFFLVNQTLSC